MAISNWMDNTTGDVPQQGNIYTGDSYPVATPNTVPNGYNPGQWIKDPYAANPVTPEDIERMSKALKRLNAGLADGVGSEKYLKLRKHIAKLLSVPINGNIVHRYMRIFYGKHNALPVDAKPKPEKPMPDYFTGSIGKLEGVSFINMPSHSHTISAVSAIAAATSATLDGVIDNKASYIADYKKRAMEL